VGEETSALVGLLGCGVVGGGVADRLLSGFSVGATTVRLGGVLVRNLAKPRFPESVYPHLTDHAERVLNDSRHDAIVECLGGVRPAADYVEAALRRGLPVVTANKALIAVHGARLTELADAMRTPLAYEASVGGAIPVLRTLRHLASVDEILEVGGIVNGTTNFVLSAMEDGLSMEDAVLAAQRAGFAEADPTTDIDGIDAAHKLAILIATAFGEWPRWESIPRRGIRDVTPDDIARARRHGRRIKLKAWARREGAEIVAAIAPTEIPVDDHFAQTRGAENAFLIMARRAGPVLIGGLGAGRDATASAIIADLRDVFARASSSTNVRRFRARA
jgi:homoserine dehydrogenase